MRSSSVRRSTTTWLIRRRSLARSDRHGEVEPTIHPTDELPCRRPSRQSAGDLVATLRVLNDVTGRRQCRTSMGL